MLKRVLEIENLVEELNVSDMMMEVVREGALADVKASMITNFAYDFENATVHSDVFTFNKTTYQNSRNYSPAAAQKSYAKKSYKSKAKKSKYSKSKSKKSKKYSKSKSKKSKATASAKTKKSKSSKKRR